MSSTILITYDDPTNGTTDITSNVIFSDASFTYQMNAVPGTFSFRVKDPDQSLEFITGREIRLFVDDVPLFGGYLMRVGMTYPFSADNTSSPGTYINRIWLLEGTDYNILFDNRIIRRTDNYLSHVPNSTGYERTTLDGWALWKLLYSFCDFPSGFGITATRADADEIDDIQTVIPIEAETANERFWYQQQGTKIREQFEERAARSGAAFYIGAEKKVHYHAWEDVYKRWGFSDNPNYLPVVGDSSDFVEPIATYGFREVAGTEDGTLIINDAFVWGGGAPVSDSTIFARIQDDVDSDTSQAGKYWVDTGNIVAGSSIAKHGRWQFAETRFNDMKTLALVKLRAVELVRGPKDGSAGTDAYGYQKGLRYPQWNFTFQWFAHDVPLVGGARDHIRAGEIIKIELAAFNVANYMPCRTLTMTFPNLAPDGSAYVQFSGEFSLQYTDPTTLWKSILGTRPAVSTAISQAVNNNSESGNYGDYGTFTPYETPDGVRTSFSIKYSGGAPAAYISQTLVVYINGLLQSRDTHYTESNPATGEFTLTTAPVATDQITVMCRMLGA